MDYFGARYMSSAQGRFTSPDPYEIVVQKNKGKTPQEQRSLLNTFISNPQAWNRYGYGLNNPLKNVDIGGKCSAPAGLKGGQTGICIEAFISMSRFGPLNVAVGDGRKFDPNGGTYRIREDVRIDQGTNGAISTNKDIARSSVIFEGLGLRGTGDVALAGQPTTDADGNRHFTVVGEGKNGFSGAPGAPQGDISFRINFTVDPAEMPAWIASQAEPFPRWRSFLINRGSLPTAFWLPGEQDRGSTEARETLRSGTSAMRNSGPLVGFLLAPLVGALFLTVWGIVRSLETPGYRRNWSCVGYRYAVFCYGAALSLGVPLYFAFKRLRLMHPMLYPVGGALLGISFRLCHLENRIWPMASCYRVRQVPRPELPVQLQVPCRGCHSAWRSGRTIQAGRGDRKPNR